MVWIKVEVDVKVAERVVARGMFLVVVDFLVGVAIR